MKRALITGRPDRRSTTVGKLTEGEEYYVLNRHHMRGIKENDVEEFLLAHLTAAGRPELKIWLDDINPEILSEVMRFFYTEKFLLLNGKGHFEVTVTDVILTCSIEKSLLKIDPSTERRYNLYIW